MENRLEVFLKKEKEYSFDIDWQEIEVPFYEDDVIEIKFFAGVYLIITKNSSSAYDHDFYRSENGVDWSLIEIDQEYEIGFEEISYVNNLWIVDYRNISSDDDRPDGFYYSIDALNWTYCKKMETPSASLFDGGMTCQKLFYFDDMWFWDTWAGTTYDTIKKGFFSDEVVEDVYMNHRLFCSESFDGLWSEWKELPDLEKGVGARGFFPFSDGESLLVYCEMDVCYKYALIVGKKNFILHYDVVEDVWSDTIWDSESEIEIDITNIYKFNSTLMCAASRGFYTSQDGGLSWNRKHIESDRWLKDYMMYVNSFYDFKDYLILTTDSSIYISFDADNFKDLDNYFYDEDGDEEYLIWEKLTVSDKGILGIYDDNGEHRLMFGTFI